MTPEPGKPKEQNDGRGHLTTSDSSNIRSERSKNSHRSDSSKSRINVEPSPASNAQTHILSPRNSLTTTRRMSLSFRTPTPVQFAAQQTCTQNVRQPPLAGLDEFDEPYDSEQNENHYRRILSQPRNLPGNKPQPTQRVPSREHPYAVPPTFSTNHLIQHAQISNSPFPPKKSPYAPPPQPNELQRAAKDFESTNS